MMSGRPWYFDPSTFEPDPKLCITCAYINLEWLLANDFDKARFLHFQSSADHHDYARPVTIPWVSETAEYVFPELSLGFLYEILERSKSCDLCRLVCSSIASSYGVEPDALLSHTFGDFPSTFVFCALGSREKMNLQEGNSYDLVIDLSNIKPHFLSFRQIRLHKIRDDAHIPFEGRSTASRVNFKTIREWLVQFKPEDATAEQEKTIPGFRVIDVVNQNVIPIKGPEGCRYLTLSYVWGGPQTFQNVKAIHRELQKPGSLSARGLPATIQDAIDLTYGVGERYLWVDSLCIVQDDADAKMAQISAMDQIYSRAVTAIVALDGTSCYSGLPGIGESCTRRIQSSATIRDVRLAFKQVVTAERNYIWPTRGWTFQEHALSARCIHFSRDGIQFESEDGVTWEDTYPPPHKTSTNNSDPTGIPSSSRNAQVGLLPNIQLYAIAMTFYSFRSLSFQKDTIHAFEGVLNVLQRRFRRGFIYGLPSSELEFSLLWQPSSELERRIDEETGRPCFPSWSWVGWKGKLTIPYTGVKQFSRVTWAHAADTTRHFTSDEWRGEDPSHTRTWKVVPNRSNLSAPWHFEDEKPNLRFANPTSKSIPKSMEDVLFVLPDSHILHIYAHIARIRSKPGHQPLDDPESGSTILAEGITSYTLYDRFDRSCGVVYLHFSQSTFDTSSLEYIAISRTARGQNNVSIEDPPSDDSDVVSIRDSYSERNKLRTEREHNSASAYFAMHDISNIDLKWKVYNGLVIHRGEDGIAERVGVGYCLCEAFWDAAPRREVIPLK